MQNKSILSTIKSHTADLTVEKYFFESIWLWRSSM